MSTSAPEPAPDAVDPDALSADELRDAWLVLSPADRVAGFRMLPPDEAEEFFQGLDSHDQDDLLHAFRPAERRLWFRSLPPDDAADLIQEMPASERDSLLALLDEPARKEVTALLAYAEDDAGGLMSPRYARARPEMTIDEAIAYLRRQARENVETINYVYVIDAQQRLLGVVSFREIFAAKGEQRMRDVMRTDLLSVSETMDQEAVSRVFSEHDLMAVPVVDADGRMKGIVTVDDIVDVVEEEATEDIHKFGGVQALEEPYLQVGFLEMLRKRGTWLAVLFLGEMLTATAMSYYEHEIGRAVVLALFIPLIISSGGNSGSQASTLVIRAMALEEVRGRDWWRVLYREIGMGLALGAFLGFVALLRVWLWPTSEAQYGEHYRLIGVTVALSLVGVVLFGTLTGSMLPFVLKRLRLDPATASAPFVATLVDVTGLVIYFGLASALLTGVLL